MAKKRRYSKKPIYSSTSTRRTDHISKGKTIISYRRAKP